MPDRPQKITFAEMRDMSVRGLLVYCAPTTAEPSHMAHSLDIGMLLRRFSGLSGHDQLSVHGLAAGSAFQRSANLK